VDEFCHAGFRSQTPQLKGLSKCSKVYFIVRSATVSANGRELLFGDAQHLRLFINAD
jgi:hypothetical protein